MANELIVGWLRVRTDEKGWKFTEVEDTSEAVWSTHIVPE